MISVIIPCHNNEKTLDRALSSVVKQTYTDLEIIVIDNGSDKPVENSDELYKDARITIYSTPEILGAAGARNKGVRMAKGEFVAFLDADDYWETDKLDKQMKVMNRFIHKGEKPVICFTGRRMVNEAGNDTGRYIGCDKIVDYKKLLRTNQINCSSVLVRTEVMKKVGFPSGKLHEDYAAWLKILSAGGFAAGINRPLLSYRVCKSSRSGNKLRSAIMNFRVYRYIGLGIFETMLHMVTYTYEGIRKHM